MNTEPFVIAETSLGCVFESRYCRTIHEVIKGETGCTEAAAHRHASYNKLVNNSPEINAVLVKLYRPHCV